ncbi:hypothetical protein ScPMuIL_002792 [Solemya velum]
MVLQNSGKYKADRGQSGSEPGSGKEDSAEKRLQRSLANDEIDIKYGFDRYKESAERVGWLINMHPADILDEDKRLVSAVNYYFIEEDGKRFKATLPFRPYFLLATKPDTAREVASFLTKRFSGRIKSVEVIQKEDLDLPEVCTTSPPQILYFVIESGFPHLNYLTKVKREINPAVRKNKEREKSSEAYTTMLSSHLMGDDFNEDSKKMVDQMENIIDIRMTEHKLIQSFRFQDGGEELEDNSRCYTKLVDDLNVDELLDHLVAAEIFTFDDNERVRNQLTTKDKAIRLVELLVHKPHSEAFETFCNCLDETRQSHLASVLRKEKASVKPVSEGEKGNTMNVDVETLQKRLSEKLSDVRLINEESLSENKKIADSRKQTLLYLKKQKHEELEKHLEELHKQINKAGTEIKDHLEKVMQKEIDDLVKFNGKMEREMKNESLCSEAEKMLASKDYEYVVRRGQKLCDQLDASLKADLKPPLEEGPAFSASFIPGKTDPDIIRGICGKCVGEGGEENCPGQSGSVVDCTDLVNADLVSSNIENVCGSVLHTSTKEKHVTHANRQDSSAK